MRQIDEMLCGALEGQRQSFAEAGELSLRASRAILLFGINWPGT